MRIAKYSTRLDNDRIPMLVREKAVNYQPEGSYKILSSEFITRLFNDVFDAQNQPQEHIYLACFCKSSLRGVFEVNVGGTNYSIVDTAAIIRDVLLSGASGFVIVHNHPSGDTAPSKDDIETTRKLREISLFLGLNFYDHIIIGESGNFLSFHHNGLMEDKI